MPITLNWINPEKTILHLSYQQPWDWTDFQRAIVQTNVLLDTVQHPVDMIIQIHGGLPRNLNAGRFRVVFQNFHDNIRMTALLGASDFIRHTINAFVRVLGQKDRAFFFASSLEDALARFGQQEAVEQPNGSP